MPYAALQEAVSGRVVLACTAPDVGPLEQCRIVEEIPLGWGFGEAALGAIDTVRIRPATRDGRPVATTMRLPFVFTAIGTVELSCGRAAAGAGLDCVVTREHPPGRGLGPPALARMASRRADEFADARWVNDRFAWSVDIRAPLEPCPEIRGQPRCEAP